MLTLRLASLGRGMHGAYAHPAIGYLVHERGATMACGAELERLRTVPLALALPGARSATARMRDRTAFLSPAAHGGGGASLRRRAHCAGYDRLGRTPQAIDSSPAAPLARLGRPW